MGVMAWGRNLARQEPVNLRLLSLGGGLDPAESKRLDQQEAHQLRIEGMRGRIQKARTLYLGDVGQTATQVVAGQTWQAEQYAMRHPEERGRVDMITDAVTMGCARIVQETAG
jgi:hypothetical protein